MAGHECYHCKRWVEEGEAHDCWTTTEAALTRDLSEGLRDAWERLRETAVSFGEQRIYASHHSIMFSRKPATSLCDRSRNTSNSAYFSDGGSKLPRYGASITHGKIVTVDTGETSEKECLALSPKSIARSFPVICVGGSAGGLDAYTRLLKNLPADMGVAIVIVNHLRTVDTQLHEILPRFTKMPVELITEKLLVQPNRVFIIPRQRDLHVLEGEFRLKPISKPGDGPT